KTYNLRADTKNSLRIFRLKNSGHKSEEEVKGEIQKYRKNL
ncbi:hypothetical protein HKBW3S42_01903, partial [Candidatus Hakubella thermalkaliphila]